MQDNPRGEDDHCRRQRRPRGAQQVDHALLRGLQRHPYEPMISFLGWLRLGWLKIANKYVQLT